jgi:hypothetical protein
VAALARFSYPLIAALVAGCASSETRSAVSTSDLPATKYQRVAVFVEYPNPVGPTLSPGVAVANGAVALTISGPSGSATDAEIEQKIVAALKSVGIDSSTGLALFQGQKLSDQAKASIIQKNFDAVLYVTVLTNGMRERPEPGAYFDGRNVVYSTGVVVPIGQAQGAGISVKADGSVWGQVPTFQAKCDLQDTKTNKIVWSSETIATGGTLVLLSQASDQIVRQLRADGAI